MSAPPPGRPNGAPRPPMQKANPLRPMRRKPANPMVAPRRGPNAPPPPPAPRSNAQNGAQQSLEQRRLNNKGWMDPPPPGAQDIPIMTTKKELLQGMRFHLMKFAQSKMDDKPVDPTDQNEFARPVTLQRRDARQPPAGRAVRTEELEAPPVDESERERMVQMKADKEAQRAIDQAKIAPVAKDPNPKPKKKQKEEKTMFHRTHKTEAAKKESDLRYEEALPWHLEDADGKNVWVGNYVAALSESTVAFRIDGHFFRMLPLEKWYKFSSKPPFQPFTIDQAEAFMNRKVDVGRWVMKNEDQKAQAADMEATRRMLYGKGTMVKTESSTFRNATRQEKLEHDELDVSGDEFQDDDDNVNFERNDDEDTKESKDRIRREQLGANLWGDGDEQEVDKDLKDQLREELERKKYGKTTKKALIKRDREDVYESENSEENPWDSSSADESSDDEEEVKEEEDQADGKGTNDSKDQDKDKDGKSGAQGKPKPDPAKSKSLKRAGSPTLSESSGNESSRKKIKKTATPAGGSRAGTPLHMRKLKTGGAGSGSDGEVTAGEMSDGAGAKIKKKKIKVIGSGQGSPSASRAGSPNPGQGSASPVSSAGKGIEAWEIVEKIPPEGITIGELIKPFLGRIGDKPGQMLKKDWIDLVKVTCDYGPDKRLRRRNR
ncbi:unnamed protein product [Clonostachys rosea f. rosea IK726]|uniref:Uncharacterized protein n=3 Tax=Bionectria ochroleuca TaxID=29856 RepID=A0A0B7K7F2_BIOOC|nr:unnamed protein product [Clonostachys rosea f. rosea IK726]